MKDYQLTATNNYSQALTQPLISYGFNLLF